MKLMLAYASSCLYNSRVTRPEPHWEGGLTDWLGIEGLGSDLKMTGLLRTRARAPSAPLLRFSQCPGSCCGAADPTDCVDRDPADQHKHWHYCLSAGGQKLWRAACAFMSHAHVCVSLQEIRMHQDVNIPSPRPCKPLYFDLLEKWHRSLFLKYFRKWLKYNFAFWKSNKLLLKHFIG